VQANGFITVIQHPVVGRTQIIDVPVRLSATPGSIRRYAPTFSEDTDALLAELGYSEQAIERLKADGAAI